MKFKFPAGLAALALAAALAACSPSAPVERSTPLAPSLISTDASPDSVAVPFGGVEVLDADPRPVDEFVAEFVGVDGRMDADGARLEYVRAATAFPFGLPDGYAFPVEPVILGEDDGYQRGYGAAGAFEFWRGAVATATVAAHERGDDDLAAELLALYEEGVLAFTGVFIATADSGGSGIDSYLRPARSGNFAPLEEFEVLGFLNRDVNRQIAVAAGDATY